MEISHSERIHNSFVVEQQPTKQDFISFSCLDISRKVGNLQQCPECSSERIFKDGLRYRADGSSVQRWLCRDCGYRFSERQNLNANENKNSIGEYAVKQPKNSPLAYAMSEIETTKDTIAGTISGILLDFAWKMKKRNLSEQTIKDRIYRLNMLIKKGADLQNPDSVETVLATSKWTPSNKRFFVFAYKAFTKFANIEWDPIKIDYEPAVPFVPLESEIDQLISGCGKRTATFLQVSKDTGARCGEVKRLRWTDINEKAMAISINKPEKHSNARIVKVTAKTIAMLNALKKESDLVFTAKLKSIQTTFSRTRNRLAIKLQNPRLKQIHFHTLRHWKGSTEYAKTKDILHVKQLLGHKRLENTEIYTHLINFESDEYYYAHACTLEEEDKLIEAGFEFIRYSEKDKVAIYRKRK